MRNKQPRKVKVSRLYLLAEEFRKTITDETEIENIDRTEDLIYELNEMIRSGELIIININSKVRSGKSTLAMSMGQFIFELLKKHKHRKEWETFGMNNICRDQQEYTKEMRDPKTSFTVKVIDEENELENTGENSTVEKALSRVISDVQAVRYVHTVWCSPKGRSSNSADIMLSVIGKDKASRTTHAKLYYRYFEGGEDYEQLLGYIRWPVGHIISNWEDNVKKVFFKTNKTEQDKKYLKQQSQKDWFIEYNIKKSEKIDMMTKEGIFRPRTLEYAAVITKVSNKLKVMASIPKIINPNIVRNYLKIECKENKIPLSIIGEELATREVMGLLDLHKALNTLKKQKLKLQNKEGPELKAVIKMLQEVAHAIYLQEQEYEKLARINEKYNKK